MTGRAGHAPPRSPAGALAGLVRESPALPATFAIAVAVVAMGASEAGYYPTTWYAAALFVLLLLAVALLALPRPVRVSKVQIAALGLLAGYAAWSYLSITWAEEPALAWEGANRSTLYVLIFALASMWPAGPRGARVLLAALGLGIAGVGLVELLRANASDQPLLYFIDYRFAEPAGYINANVALWTLGMLPCLFIACAREVVWPVRALALGGAGLLGALSLMGQSRGWALALPVALVVFVALGPGRVRKLGVVLLAGLGTAAVSQPVLDLHDKPGRFPDLLSDATTAVLLMTAVLVVLGAAIALAERRVEVGPAALRRVRVGVGAIVAAAVVVGLIGLVVATGDPFERVSDAWHTFKEGAPQAEEGTSRFATAGTNRYEIWSVAFDLFEENPVGGIGADGFQQPYLERGTSGERPRFAHSLELGVLAQTGLVGALLLLGALLAAVWAGIRTLRRGGHERAMAAAAAMTVTAYWLVHGSVDWFWEFPALAGAAWLALGTAGALAPREADGAPGAAVPADEAPGAPAADATAPAPDAPAPTPAPRRSRTAGGIAVAVLLAAVGLALAVSLAGPWASELEIQEAADSWEGDPQAAYDRLDRARWLNPLSAKPDLTAGTIALRAGDQNLAGRMFERAVERDTHNAYAMFELGLLAAGRDDRAAAEDYLARALKASPRDELTKETLAEVRAGKRVSAERVNRLLLKRALARGAQGQ